MFKISAETYRKSGINTIIVSNERNKLVIWLNMHDIHVRLGVKNMSDLTIKEIKCIFKRNPWKQEIEEYKAWAEDGFIYNHEDLALKIIMNFKVPTAVEFRTKLGFKEYDIMINKKSSVLTNIMKAFAKEEIMLPHCVLN